MTAAKHALVREPLRQRAGARFRFGLSLAALLLLPSCGLLPPLNYNVTTLPFTAEQGWVQLPTRRWLLNPGIDLDIALFCPAQTCAGEQSFVARFELSGREAGFADLLARDPGQALSATSPTTPRRDSQRISRQHVTPLAVAGWAGGSLSIHSRKTGSATAEVAVMARREGARAFVMMAVAPTRAAAIRRVAQAAE